MRETIKQTILNNTPPTTQPITVDVPTQKNCGDLTTNIAMLIAKETKQNPETIAAPIITALKELKHVDNVHYLNGFINITLTNEYYKTLLYTYTSHPYGIFDHFNKSFDVILEYVSANPTGPLHAGHTRWAVYGRALSSLLQTVGTNVIDVSYINDKGNQINNYVDSIIAAQKGDPVPEDGYHGQYIQDWAQSLPNGLDRTETTKWAIEKALSEHRKVYSNLRIYYHQYVSEQDLYDTGTVDRVLNMLTNNIYNTEGAMYLKTSLAYNGTQLDDQDRVIIKSDGTHTYFLPDIANHYLKFKKTKKAINIFGADHHGYIGRLKAATLYLTGNPDDLEIIIGQPVSLIKNGQPVTMSKREGNILTAKNLIDKLGSYQTSWLFLSQSINSCMTIDFDNIKPDPTATKFAAIKSTVNNKRKFVQVNEKKVKNIYLFSEQIAVLRVIENLPYVISRAVELRAPHLVIEWIKHFVTVYETMINKYGDELKGVSSDIYIQNVVFKAVHLACRSINLEPN